MNTFKSDIPAGLVVFLVALPLCLGIALASGAPLMSGVISGIIGGVIVGILSGSSTSVSGPAAGLSAVVLTAIHQLGSFEVFLFAVLLAGIFQLILGFGKLGFIADFFPSNVIKGLLAAIGIVLILKQIPHAIGYDADYEGDFQFFDAVGDNTIGSIFHALRFITPGAVFISFLSMLILLYWDKTPLKKLIYLPPSLAVVLLGIGISSLCNTFFTVLSIEQSHMVNIPSFHSLAFNSLFHVPDLGLLIRRDVWTVAITLGIVASLETLLNLEAVDKIDPHKRHSPPNRELIAQGVGNICASFFGGIPVTSVIVRSSVNIQSNNATKASTIIHGLLLLLSVLFLAPFMNMIPLSSLAAILLVTGYKLASFNIFKAMYNKGKEQFIPFFATIIAIVFTDLLIGVLVGLAVSIAFLMISNFKNPFLKQNYTLHIGEILRLELPNQVTFLNKSSIRESLEDIPNHSNVVIDASSSDYIDHDVLEIIEDFKTTIAPEKDIKLNVIGQRNRFQLHDHVQFVNVLNKEVRDSFSPVEILNHLQSGNKRFVDGELTQKDFGKQIEVTSKEQNPMCVIIGCIDSRTTPELLFDSGLGDILTIRIAGNIINQDIIGSLEIACSKLGARLIVVKSHSKCGAVLLAMNDVNNNSIGSITSKIKRVAEKINAYPLKNNSGDEQLIEIVAKENAINGVQEILQLSPLLSSMINEGKLGIISAYHDISTGKVEFGDLITNIHQISRST
ncbi:MAG: bifunctional SulP family inorganic anion transporter/carbonic anhydrase [Bacteroidota bacterium]